MEKKTFTSIGFYYILKIFTVLVVTFLYSMCFCLGHVYAGNPDKEIKTSITNNEWALSTSENLKPVTCYLMACTTPGAPGTPGVSSVGSTTASASWTASSCSGCSITYYWVVGTSSTVTYNNGVTQGTTAGLTANITGLSCNTTYYFRVYAYNSCGTSSGYATSSSFTTSSVSGVTVNGGGTYCGSKTITATGGTNGTIYWQNTTSGGTSIRRDATRSRHYSTPSGRIRRRAGWWSPRGTPSS